MSLAQAPSLMVQDELTLEWVLFAPRRAGKPESQIQDHLETRIYPSIPPPEEQCRLCPIKLPIEELIHVPAVDEPHFFTAINRFPAIGTEPGQPYGQQEILIEGLSHRPVLDWTAGELAQMLGYQASRMRLAAEDPKISYVVVFKNEGEAAGASQPHPHSQLWATAFVPPKLESWQTQWQYLMAYRKRCPFCHELEAQSGGAGVIYEDGLVMAYAHPVARFAYEVRIVTKRHVDSLGETDASERLSLGNALSLCFRFLRARGAAFNLYTQNIIRDRDQHMELRLTPRITTWAGVEISSGFYVNPVLPEEAAAAYREA